MSVGGLQLADVFAARRSIEDIVERTPTVASKLAATLGEPLWLKLETLQPTGAFKLRGASHAIACLTADQRSRGVVCCSTGNHGRAVAYAAGRMGVAATVCLSSLVPETKVAAVRALGADVVRAGRSQDDAQREVDRLVADQGMAEIPPFDDPRVIAGQGTIGLELLEAHPDLQSILVPLSGGGLIAGIALAVKKVNPHIRVVGISMDRGAAMAASLDAGMPVEVEEVASLADSLGGGVGVDNTYTFEMVRSLVDEVVLVSEQEIYRGMQSLFFDERIVAEGAAAVGHAALLAGRVAINGPSAIIITGNNVDMTQFTAVIAGQAIRVGNHRVWGRPYG